MFCPRCRDEYRAGYDRCESCDLPLVHQLPPATPHPDVTMVSVFETADASLLPVIKSVLDSAGIPYLVQGDEAAGILPLGPLATGLFEHAMAAAVRVPADRADEARALLAEVDDAPPPDDAYEDDAAG